MISSKIIEIIVAIFLITTLSLFGQSMQQDELSESLILLYFNIQDCAGNDVLLNAILDSTEDVEVRTLLFDSLHLWSENRKRDVAVSLMINAPHDKTTVHYAEIKTLESNLR